MCGRFATRFTRESLLQKLSLGTTPDMPGFFTPRYNIAPTQPVYALRQSPDNRYTMASLRWGLVPHWSQGPSPRYAMHNARIETITAKPAYRQAFTTRRCLIPADGWYEWQKVSTLRQPYFIHHPDHAVFCFAGLWDRWRNSDGTELHSCTIITTNTRATGTRATGALAHLAAVHPRMPIVLPAASYKPWLNPALRDKTDLLALLAVTDSADMTTTAVSRHVNNARNNDPRCTDPLAHVESGSGQ